MKDVRRVIARVRWTWNAQAGVYLDVASRRVAAGGIWRVVEPEDDETRASPTTVRKQSLPVIFLIRINFELLPPWTAGDDSSCV